MLRLKTFALLPAIIFQGTLVKKNTPRLPEPAGIRTGQSGVGQNLSLLVLGDSSAAGVGVEKQQDALLGQVLKGLANLQVHYWMNACTGATSKHLLKRVQKSVPRQIDVVICALGVNDITQLTAPDAWLKTQKQLYTEIEQRFQPKLILVMGVPPMQLFPALPQPLAGLFGDYAQAMNKKLKSLAQVHGNMHVIDYDLERFQAMNLPFAEDGFHPSAEIYAEIANQLVGCIKSKLGFVCF